MSGRSLRFLQTLIVWLCISPAHAVIIPDKILFDESSPFGTPDVRVLNLFSATINELGQVAVSSRLTGPRVDGNTNQALWTDATGSLELVARLGDSIDESPTLSLQGLRDFWFDDRGRVSYRSPVTSVEAISGRGGALWRWEQKQAHLVIPLVGSPLEPISAGQLAAFGAGFSMPWRVNGSGQYAIQAGLTPESDGPLESAGWWLGHADALERVVGTGVPAPGIPGVTFGIPGSVSLNDSGRLAFVAALIGDSVLETNDLSVWLTDGESMKLIAREGSVTPGIQAAVFVEGSSNPNNFGLPSINERGDAVFTARFRVQGESSSDQFGVWAHVNGITDLVAQTGNPSDIESNGQFTGFNRVWIAESGVVTLRASATLEGQSTHGFWSDAKGQLQPIATTGQEAPQTAGAHFVSIDDDAANGKGYVVFSALLEGDSVTGSNKKGIWVADPYGNVSLLIRTGDEIAVPGPAPSLLGATRIVNDLALVSPSLNGHDGLRSALNDSGELAFIALLNDGTRRVLVMTIPEPSILLVLALALVAGRSRHPARSGDGDGGGVEVQ